MLCVFTDVVVLLYFRYLCVHLANSSNAREKPSDLESGARQRGCNLCYDGMHTFSIMVALVGLVCLYSFLHARASIVKVISVYKSTIKSAIVFVQPCS